MGVDDLSDLTPQERADLLRSRLAAVKGKHEPAPQQDTQTPHFDPDLVPEVDPTETRLPEPLQQLDDFVNSLDIVEAYRVLINKSEPNDNGQKEVQVSCPNPAHPDTNPSASLNRQENVWICYGCGAKGDTMDLAAIHFGASWPETYKTNGEFHPLKRQLGEKFGIHVVKSPVTGKEQLAQIEEEPEPVPEKLASVTRLPNSPDESDYVDTTDLFIDWERLIPEDTFLWRWMKTLATDHIPHEYHFWIGLMAVGLAAGHDVVMLDRKNVKGNLYVCIYGASGIGKTLAIEPVEKLLREASPFKEDDYLDPVGVKMVSSPGSGEILIDMFSYKVLDAATTPPVLDHHANVTGLLNQSEFSELMKKAERMGSSLKEVLINMYDADSEKLITASARSSGHAVARGPFCSLITSTQPKVVKKYLKQSDVDSGSLNRFVFAIGSARTAPKDYDDSGEPDLTDCVDAYKELQKWCNNGSKGREVEFATSPARHQVWKDFFQQELAPVKSGQVDQDSIYARMDLMLKKITLLFCMNENKTVPDADLMQRVLALYPYLKLTYSRFSDSLNLAESEELEMKIKDYCMQHEEKTGKPASLRDIKRSLGKTHGSESIVKAVKNLTAVGELEEIAYRTGRGPTTQRYKYVV